MVYWYAGRGNSAGLVTFPEGGEKNRIWTKQKAFSDRVTRGVLGSGPLETGSVLQRLFHLVMAMRDRGASIWIVGAPAWGG